MKTMEFYLDPKLVKEASEILEDLGLDIETAIRIFLTKIAHEFEWPYEHKDEEGKSIVAEETILLGKPTKVKVDDYTYEESTNFFKYDKLNFSSVVNEFLLKVKEKNGIPFTIKKRKFSKKLLRALSEADDIASGKIKTKTYHSVEELFADLNKDIDKNTK